MKIYGIPHGEKVILEITSSLFQLIQRYELITIPLNDKLIIKMNIALEWNYFSNVNKNLMIDCFYIKKLFS
jgi:hypothetical protein